MTTNDNIKNHAALIQSLQKIGHALSRVITATPGFCNYRIVIGVTSLLKKNVERDL